MWETDIWLFRAEVSTISTLELHHVIRNMSAAVAKITRFTASRKPSPSMKLCLYLAVITMFNDEPTLWPHQ